MNTPASSIKIVTHDSAYYWQSVYLRFDLLRNPLGLTFTKNELNEEKNQIHFVYLEHERVRGCLILVPVDQDIIKMRQVAVHQDFQEYGIGKKLVLFSEDYARKNGYKIMTCYARKTAVPFYEKLDYKTEGDEFTEVTIPHFKMMKRL